MPYSFRASAFPTQPLFRGVEDHQIESCVENFVESFRRLAVKHVNVAESDSPSKRAEALQVVDIAIEQMKSEVLDLVDRYIQEIKLTP